MPSQRGIALLAAAAAALVPAATADAARIERFVAFYRIEQRTTWAERRIDATVGCDRVFFERHGTETATLRTTPMRVRLTRLPSGSAAIAFGPSHRPATGLAGAGRARRTFVFKSFRINGPCTPAPGVTIGRDDDVDTECDGRFRSSIAFVSGPRRWLMPVIRMESSLLPGALMLDCDIERHEHVSSPVTAIRGTLPAARVFGEEEYVIVRARDSFRREFQQGGSTTTHVSWTLRMRRAR